MPESAELTREPASAAVQVLINHSNDRDASNQWQRALVQGCEVYCYGQPLQKECRTAASPGLIGQLYRAQGSEFIHGLTGHYALIIDDRRSGTCHVFADRFATHRLYYRSLSCGLIIADNLQALRGAVTEPLTLSRQAVVNYLYHHMIPSPKTVYEGVYCLEPAQRVTWRQGALSTETWWQPAFEQQTSQSEQQLADELFVLMQDVVADYCTKDKTGCFLSGGLDSSSLAGLVSQSIPSPEVFSIGFPIAQYNEIDYARAAVEHFGLNGHEYCMTPQDVVAALPQVVGSMDQPFGNSSVIPTYFCAQLARSQGVNRLIAGDGGDELFAGNQRYATQLQRDRWRQRLKPLIGMLDLTLLRSSLPDSPALLGKAKSFTRQLKMTIPENVQYYNFLNLLDRKAIFSASVVKGVDLFEPDRQCQQLYDVLPDASPLDRLLYLDWKHTLADNDLVKVNSMCRLAGVDVVYPMLDDRLVDYSLRVPASIKLTRGNLRHLYKRAMGGFLPDKILHKTKHGFGLPFGLWTKDHPQLQKLAYEAIDSLRRYDLFQKKFIDEAINRHKSGHASYYGELVWVLMVLALWLDRNY
ncbi:asparagine synthetase B family protein [Marinobacterium rhizophilum]|uniref:asparagine synthetase B family protein n=1 Tax=Marinobacterium rhizophilum TaxID=420402 RepID=UPI0009FB9B5B|nr:asparagine synthase-related protein [Marinobacterium rhizophilum]